jgi:hypothetical protein
MTPYIRRYKPMRFFMLGKGGGELTDVYANNPHEL